MELTWNLLPPFLSNEPGTRKDPARQLLYLLKYPPGITVLTVLMSYSIFPFFCRKKVCQVYNIFFWFTLCTHSLFGNPPGGCLLHGGFFRPLTCLDHSPDLWNNAQYSTHSLFDMFGNVCEALCYIFLLYACEIFGEKCHPGKQVSAVPLLNYFFGLFLINRWWTSCACSLCQISTEIA
jgi:hypothetical protein